MHTEEPSTPRSAYSVEAFARELSISRGTVYNMLADGRLRAVKIGRRTLIPAGELQRLLEAPEAA